MKKEKILLIGFALSNMSALIYEVVWSRELGYVFGTSVYAISTVLTCFMAGIALGSFIFGRLADRQKNPMKLFALIEIGIGIYGILIIGIFSIIGYPYRFLFNSFHNFPFLFLFSQFILAFIALILPTTFIGGTFPVMSKIYTKKFNALGEKVGVVYSLDTIGAAVGSFSSGFILMPILGLNKTTLFAALMNLAVGAIIYQLSEETILQKVKRIKHKKIKLKNMDGAILLSFFLSGFAALTYEVVWTRFLSLIFGTSVYAFSTMLTAFMLGLAIGSYIVSKIVDGLKDPVGIFVIIELGIGSYALFLLLLFSRMDILYFTIYSKWNSFSGLWLIFFLVILFLLLAPTTLMGATLPLVSKIYSHDPRTIGGDIGAVFSSNTFGGIFGSFAAGFLLIPLMGVEKTSIVAVALNIAAAGLMFNFSKIDKKSFLAIIGVFFITGGIMSTYNVDPLQAGMYYQGIRYSSLAEYKKAKANTRLLFKKEDPHGLVTVTKRNFTTALQINGKIDATNTVDIPNEYMLAYIPLLIHEEPKTALNIGLGAGFTLSAIEDFDVNSIDVIEINPAVVDVAKEEFTEYNGHALDDPRVNLIIADARNYLFTSNKKYDVIISEPSNPWLSGENSLFTKEFYEIVKEHLNDGGVFTQWVPMYDHTAEDFKIFLNTFHSVFPYVQIYSIKGTDAILIGSMKEQIFDFQKLAERFETPGFKKHFSELKYFAIGIAPAPRDIEYFLSFYFMGPEEILDYIEGTTTTNTDDYPILEFNTAKASFKKGIPLEGWPLLDMIDFKLKRQGMILATPPIKNIVESRGSRDVMDLFGVAVEKGEDWSLQDLGYSFSFSKGAVRQYHILRSFSYMTPKEKLSWIRIDNVRNKVSREEIGKHIAHVQLLRNLDTVGEMEMNGHSAYLFTDGARIFAGWHCTENDAIYVLILPFTEDIEGAEEIFRHVKCTH